MNPARMNLLNGVALILLSLWGYFSSASPSFTALIPVVFGILLLALNGGLKKENKVVSHIVVVLTLLVFIALFKPLGGAMERGDNLATARVLIMMLFSLLALISFINSFIQARKSK